MSEVCQWCGVEQTPVEPVVEPVTNSTSIFTHVPLFVVARASCPSCEDLPHETAVFRRLVGTDALDLLACQLVGLRWEVVPRGIAVALGLTTWADYIQMTPTAESAAKPFDWWPHLDDLLAKAWEMHGVHPGESTAYAIQRWLGPMHYSRARECYGVSLGRERRRSPPAGVAT